MASLNAFFSLFVLGVTRFSNVRTCAWHACKRKQTSVHEGWLFFSELCIVETMWRVFPGRTHSTVLTINIYLILFWSAWICTEYRAFPTNPNCYHFVNLFTTNVYIVRICHSSAISLAPSACGLITKKLEKNKIFQPKPSSSSHVLF